MPQFLTLPPWEAIHPLVVHFPVALLTVVPLLVLTGALIGGVRGRAWLHAALLLMLLGTIGTFVAVETGEAGDGVVKLVAGAKPLLHEHEELAELARNSFTVLTILFALLVLVPAMRKREPTRLTVTVLPLLFLLPYLGGVLVLANAAHHGGRLVHERGVYAHWKTGGAQEASPAVPQSSGERDRED